MPTNGLSGTSATVTVNGTTVNIPMYFTRSDVVVGIMPSNTPTGNGNLILTYNTLRVASSVTVMAANFGISNIAIASDNNTGLRSQAAVTFADGKPITPTNTAKPGDTLVIWGTGLGATPNNGGDTDAPPAGNIGATPKIFVGGVQSPSVGYWGRSPGTIPGLDQINFTVPPDAPLGCNVSVAVQTATPNVVSNAPTISLAQTDGAACSDPLQAITPAMLTRATTKIGVVDLKQSDFACPPGFQCSSSTESHAGAQFFSFTQTQLAALATQENEAPSYGTCYTAIASTSSSGDGTPPGTLLDGGPSMTLTPPSGPALTLPADIPGAYSIPNSSNPILSGAWSFANGSGGPGVPAFKVSVQIAPKITWTNQSAAYSGQIDRTVPLNITWTGGDPGTFVHITGWANNAAGSYMVGFECAAPVSSGRFTIPSSILLAMPTGFNQSAISVATKPIAPVNLSVPGLSSSGLDGIVTSFRFETIVPVGYK
jgi:uncharacterized protein (TIGR03437 family)